MLAEGTSKQYIYFNDHVVGYILNNQLYFVHNDHLGRPEVITNALKNVVWRAKLEAFDRSVLSTSIGEFNIGFPGQYWDAEKGSWYNYFRDYDATLGRYLQSDPIGLAGGLNTYGYVFNRPTSLTDPTGLWPDGNPNDFYVAGQSWTHGVRAPDYIQISMDAYILNGYVQLSRSGNYFVGGGFVRQYPNPSSGGFSMSAAWLTRCETPTGTEVDDFLTGHGNGFGGGYLGLGAGGAWTPENGTAFMLGFGIGFSANPGTIGYPQGPTGLGGW
ncbi:RHS repeat-associated core domain-containing protein [Rheinheimera sp. MM224]|uniref:RHS repeat-associated core domain-containing protein n=1 Tax=Rheinheimera sp. MM224 TaxID=3019969 RepID=UPI0021F8A01A|nr:RHS repeat-associated core domain-containing protein [Rheinheimera sp. MM224]CAI3791909.1 hypothetical protein JAMGFMIE_00426 [Rheinheimera sp. MM224]